jgi:hypothetical protein
MTRQEKGNEAHLVDAGTKQHCWDKAEKAACFGRCMYALGYVTYQNCKKRKEKLRRQQITPCINLRKEDTLA